MSKPPRPIRRLWTARELSAEQSIRTLAWRLPCDPHEKAHRVAIVEHVRDQEGLSPFARSISPPAGRSHGRESSASARMADLTQGRTGRLSAPGNTVQPRTAAQQSATPPSAPLHRTAQEHGPGPITTSDHGWSPAPEPPNRGSSEFDTD